MYTSTMMRTVKIDEKLYKEIKAFAKGRGQFLQHVLNDAIARYLDDKKRIGDWRSERKTQ